jgi:hypothetical protein
MPPVGFETDRGGFGVVRFAQAEALSRPRKAASPDPLHQALEATLKVRIETRREGLFGPRVSSFAFMGQRVRLKALKTGGVEIDLSRIDDDVREILIEHLRLSQDFDRL